MRRQLIHIKGRIQYHRITRRNVKHTMKKNRMQYQAHAKTREEEETRNFILYTFIIHITLLYVLCGVQRENPLMATFLTVLAVFC